jgi:hypothetical protein
MFTRYLKWKSEVSVVIVATLLMRFESEVRRLINVGDGLITF